MFTPTKGLRHIFKVRDKWRLEHRKEYILTGSYAECIEALVNTTRYLKINWDDKSLVRGVYRDTVKNRWVVQHEGDRVYFYEADGNDAKRRAEEFKIKVAFTPELLETVNLIVSWYYLKDYYT